MFPPNYKPLWWTVCVYYTHPELKDEENRGYFQTFEQVQEYLNKKNLIFKPTSHNRHIWKDGVIVGYIDFARTNKEVANGYKGAVIEEALRNYLLNLWGFTKNSHKVRNHQLVYAISLDEFRRSVYLASLKEKIYSNK